MPTDAHTAFERLVTHDFDQASLEDVKTVALGLWYQDFVPDFTQLSVTNLQSQLRAGYLVDRLLRYNCVSDERKKTLFADVTALKTHLKPAASTKPNVEPLAKNWGLDQDLKRLAKELLPYQTRHYQRICVGRFARLRHSGYYLLYHPLCLTRHVYDSAGNCPRTHRRMLPYPCARTGFERAWIG